MNNFKNLCQKFDASIVQKLYKKITDNTGKIIDKDVFPVALVQSIYDAISGMRLDDILTHYNYINVSYKGSKEATRLVVPIGHRRKDLIITYRNYDDESIVEQYIGDTINDESWKHEDNWKTPFTEGNFTINVTNSQLEQYINEYFDSHDISNLINLAITDIVHNYLNTEEGNKLLEVNIKKAVYSYLSETIDEDWLKELIAQVISERLESLIKEYFESEAGKEIIREAIEPQLEELLGEYFAAFKKYIEDNERVIANALVRHEQAITDLQN